jgi:hypothetical protein
MSIAASPPGLALPSMGISVSKSSQQNKKYTGSGLASAGISMQVHGQVPDASIVTTDIVLHQGSILQLTKQLDRFLDKDTFLARFRMLGCAERRQGGAHPWPCPYLKPHAIKL